MSRKKKPSGHYIHDAIVESLRYRLESDDRVVLSEYEYNHIGDHEADILVLNYNQKYAYAIEVKTTNYNKARRKAKKQLKADERYINDIHKIERVFKFYAYKSKRRSKRLYDICLIE